MDVARELLSLHPRVLLSLAAQVRQQLREGGEMEMEREREMERARERDRERGVERPEEQEVAVGEWMPWPAAGPVSPPREESVYSGLMPCSRGGSADGVWFGGGGRDWCEPWQESYVPLGLSEVWRVESGEWRVESGEWRVSGRNGAAEQGAQGEGEQE
jgi:hypothetical protein